MAESKFHPVKTDASAPGTMLSRNWKVSFDNIASPIHGLVYGFYDLTSIIRPTEKRFVQHGKFNDSKTPLLLCKEDLFKK